MTSASSPPPFPNAVALKPTHDLPGAATSTLTSVSRTHCPGMNPRHDTLLTALASGVSPGTRYPLRYGSIWSAAATRGLERRTRESHS